MPTPALKAYYVEFGCNCTVVRAKNERAAWNYLYDEFGRYEMCLARLRPATDEDIARVEAMSGIIHEAD